MTRARRNARAQVVDGHLPRGSASWGWWQVAFLFLGTGAISFYLVYGVLR
jgi:hypothetical protein